MNLGLFSGQAAADSRKKSTLAMQSGLTQSEDSHSSETGSQPPRVWALLRGFLVAEAWNRSGGIGRRSVTAVGWLGMGEGKTVRALLGVVGQGWDQGGGWGVVSEGGYRPKLIEVALPLAAINVEVARGKSIRRRCP